MAYEYVSRVHYDDIDRHLSLSLRGAIRQMQEAAAVDSGRCGYGLKDIPRTRVVWAVVEWRVRLLEQCSWAEHIRVRTWPKSMERAIGERNFEILDDREARVAVGESKWILINADTGRAACITPEIAQAYDLEAREVFEEPTDLQPPQTRELAFSYTPMRRDIDTNGHVNNLVYLDLACQALPDDVYSSRFSEVSLRFFREVKFGDEIQCFYAKKNGRHFAEILNRDGTVRHALVVLQ